MIVVLNKNLCKNVLCCKGTGHTEDIILMSYRSLLLIPVIAFWWLYISRSQLTNTRGKFGLSDADTVIQQAHSGAGEEQALGGHLTQSSLLHTNFVISWPILFLCTLSPKLP